LRYKGGKNHEYQTAITRALKVVKSALPKFDRANTWGGFFKKPGPAKWRDKFAAEFKLQSSANPY
jgi:hypothetical protein